MEYHQASESYLHENLISKHFPHKKIIMINNAHYRNIHMSIS